MTLSISYDTIVVKQFYYFRVNLHVLMDDCNADANLMNLSYPYKFGSFELNLTLISSCTVLLIVLSMDA